MPARRFALFVWLAAGLLLAAAGHLPAQEAAAPPAAATGVGTDERTTRLADRYKAMLSANPVEGVGLDRLWKLYEERGDTGKLLEEYRQLSLHPAPGKAGQAASLVYGHLLRRAGRLDEAAATYQHAASTDPADPLPSLALADLAAGRGKPDAAAQFYTQALGKLAAGDARRPDLLLKLGSAWLAAGQPLKAAEQWEAMISLDPANVSLRRELAANYEKNSLPDRAVGHYEYIDKHGTPAERAQALRDLGRLHQVRGEFDAARDAFERGLALTSRENWLHGEIEQQLIRLYQRAGRVPELAVRWRSAIVENPRDLGGYLRLEHLAEAEADTEGQRAALQKLIALVPKDRESTLKLARLLADAGEREQAAALYDSLLKFQPENLDLILARADLDLQLNRPAAAVERVEARVTRSPTDESVTSPALEFFLSHHLDEAAERRLRADAVRQPGADDPALALAKFLFAQRKPTEAKEVLEALAARPGDPAARAARLSRAAEAYKEQNSPDDALRCWKLAAEIQPQLPPPHLAISELLLARRDIPGACAALERAVEATPAGPERLEVERKLFQALQSDDLAPPPLNRPPGRIVAGGASAAGRPFVRIISPLGMDHVLGSPGMPAATPSPDGSALARYLAKIEASAKTSPTAENYVRFARWSQWARNLPAAIEAAETAARIDPRDLSSRELLASLAIDGRQREVAERWLREIMAIDASRQASCLKQIATIALDQGDVDASLATFAELQRAAPGSVAALTDLALAHQRADRWFDALGDWERAYALPGVTLAQRAEIRRPLLVALERLDQFTRAGQVLQSAIDDQPDLEAKQDLFRELTAFCRQHGLVATLHKDYESRLKAQPQDYFLLTALAEMRRSDGHEREAYRLLGQAYYSAPDPARSLRTLVDGAESLGAIDEAIGHQRRLTALPGQGNLENLERLASLEDRGAQAEAAARTWENVVSRYPRDPLALSHAETFFESSGNTRRARELLGQVARLNAADSRQLFHLGEMDVAASDPGAARAAFDQLLATTEAEKPGSPLVLPADLDKGPPLDIGSSEAAIYRGVFRTAGTVSAPPPAPPAEGSDYRFRLRAIGEISRLLFPGKAAAAAASTGRAASDEARNRWLAHWQEVEKAGGRSEPLWAFFHANQKGLVMDCLTRWLGKQPADRLLHKGFLGLGVRMGEYRRVAAWTWSPDPAGGGQRARGRELVQILSQWLVGSEIETGGNLVAELFPVEVKARDSLWLAANNVFAARQRYGEAAELGERIFENAPAEFRPAYGLEVAHWELYLDHADRARTLLRRAFADNESDTLDTSTSSVFAAMREYYLLLAAGERRSFVENYLAAARKKSGRPHLVLSGVLLHGLEGDEPAARRDLDALLEMRLLANEEGSGSPDSRRWAYVLANGMQLSSWNLLPLAAYYWRHALAEVTAFDRQQNDSQQTLGEIYDQLFLTETALAANPQDAREQVDNYLRTRPPAPRAGAIATQLMGASRFAEAARIHEYLCELEPDVAEHWQERFASLKSAGAFPAAECLWRGVLDGELHLSTGLSRSEVVRQLAGLLENDLADPTGARQLLWRERETDKGAVSLILTQLASSYERAGQWENAVQIWRKIPSDPGAAAILAVARIETQHLNRPGEAIALLKPFLERNGSVAERSRIAVAVTGPQLAAGQVDEAINLGFDLLHDSQPDAVASVAVSLDAHGEHAAARQLLSASVWRTHDPLTRLRQQKALVELIAATPGDDPIFERELRRLRMIADETATLRAVFDDVRFDLARKRHREPWLEGELLKDWREGQGRMAAGEDLARLYVETHRSALLAAVVTKLLARATSGDTLLVRLQKLLAESDETALTASVSKEIFRLNPLNASYGLAYARALWRDKRTDEARHCLASLALTAATRDDIWAQIGQTCLDLGDKALAREYFSLAAAADPLAVRSPNVHLALAELNLDENHLADARQSFRAAYRNPASDDLKPLVRYLVATTTPGAENMLRLSGGDFPLPSSRRARLLPLMTRALDSAHREEDARRLLAAHPEWLTAVPGFVETLRMKLPSSDFTALASLASLFEGAIAQSDPPCHTLNRQLVTLYTAWADHELSMPEVPGATDSAVAHLKRARAVDAAYFPAAARLARWQMDHKQADAAAEILRPFASDNALPEEQAASEHILHKG